MNCDICGKEAVLRKALIERCILNVCEDCVGHGVELEDKKKVENISKKEEIVESIIPDYQTRIKTRREELNLNQKQLALEINEKESVIHLIETGKLSPQINTAKKLENFLKISLIIKPEREDGSKELKIDFKNSNLTIRDLIKLRDE